MQVLQSWLLLLFLVLPACTSIVQRKYQPRWSDLDTRQIPEWYDDAKIGILVHWGVYSVPGVHSEWFWKEWQENNTEIVEFMKKNYPPNYLYKDFAREFKAEFFDAADWASLFFDAGAKYVVMMSKHHDGYALFPSSHPDGWNSMTIGPGRDLVRDVATAVRNKGLKFGVYYSLYEWFNPLYQHDKRNHFKTQNFTNKIVLPDLRKLVTDYSPEVIWADGDMSSKDLYWKSKRFLSWLYSASPVKDTVVVNDRWGIGTICHHGGFHTCKDRYHPKTLEYHKWENAFSLDKKSWGYRRKIKLEEVMSTEELLLEVVSTVSYGGNVLINVGPTKEGTIIPIFRSRLIALGAWLKVNGPAIYGTTPWLHQQDSLNPHVWYTRKSENRLINLFRRNYGNIGFEKSTVFAIILKWPADNLLRIRDVLSVLNEQSDISILGNEEIKINNLKRDKVQFKLPNREKLKSNLAWVLRFS